MAAETTAVTATEIVDTLKETDAAPRRGRAATKKRSKVLTYVGLVLASCVAVFPLLFMVFSSFKDDQQIFADLGSLKAFLPTGHLSMDNYVGVFDRVPAARFITNSLVVTVAIVVLGLIVNSMQEAHQSEENAITEAYRDEVLARLRAIEAQLDARDGGGPAARLRGADPGRGEG